MKHLVCALAVLILFSTPVRAEWSANFQLEHYKWTERTNPQVKISGWQPGVGISWMQEGESRLRFRYRGEVYASSLKYQGALQSGTPVQDTVDYKGVVNEIHALYGRIDRPWQLVLGLGFDYWERRFPFGLSGTSAAGHQREDWWVGFVRLGLELGRRTRPGGFASIGFKYPLSTKMNAHLDELGMDQNPEITPGGEPSVYADLGYKVGRDWRFTLYYDSYRFSQSPAVTATAGGVTSAFLQPRSTQDQFGVRVELAF